MEYTAAFSDIKTGQDAIYGGYEIVLLDRTWGFKCQDVEPSEVDVNDKIRATCDDHGRTRYYELALEIDEADQAIGVLELVTIIPSAVHGFGRQRVRVGTFATTETDAVLEAVLRFSKGLAHHTMLRRVLGYEK